VTKVTPGEATDVAGLVEGDVILTVPCATPYDNMTTTIINDNSNNTTTSNKLKTRERKTEKSTTLHTP
jgi:hypothetical protein